MDDRVAALFRKDQIAICKIFGCAFPDTNSAIVISKSGISNRCCSTSIPCYFTPTVGRGIARAIVNDALPVVESQPIALRPACILIAVRCLNYTEIPRRIGILFFARQVACAVVAVDDGLLPADILPRQAAKSVIFVGGNRTGVILDRGDVPARVIGIGQASDIAAHCKIQLSDQLRRIDAVCSVGCVAG